MQIIGCGYCLAGFFKSWKVGNSAWVIVYQRTSGQAWYHFTGVVTGT